MEDIQIINNQLVCGIAIYFPDTRMICKDKTSPARIDYYDVPTKLYKFLSILYALGASLI